MLGGASRRRTFTPYDMPSTRHGLAALPLALAALAACSSGGSTAPKTDPATSSASTPFDDTVRVMRSQATRVDGGRLTITYTDLTDSRCPANAACVWQGDAAATLRLEAGGTSANATLHTALEPKATTHAGYTITLVRADPYPGTEPENARLAPTLLLRVARR
jgi:hypothetical protein